VVVLGVEEGISGVQSIVEKGWTRAALGGVVARDSRSAARNMASRPTEAVLFI
jgi:hypothetical protein